MSSFHQTMVPLHLFEGLSINRDYVDGLVSERGLFFAAKSLGYTTDNYDNMQLAGRIAVYLLKEKLGTSLDEWLKRMNPILDPRVYQFYLDNLGQLQEVLNKREKQGDLNYDWFSANTLLKTYLTKLDYDSDDVIETPFQMFLRIAVAKYYNTTEETLLRIEEDFLDLANQLYIPASPIIFNSGLINGQLASCFLGTSGDSLESIYHNWIWPTALISKNNGASGWDISRIRHSRIKNKGYSKGLIPWIKIQNDNIRAVDQGGKRKGACTLYCRPHHIDIYEFCEMPLKEGDSNMRGQDLNYAIWFPRLFWERVKNDEGWTLFCPNETERLNDLWGLEWEEEYMKYELADYNINPNGYWGGTKRNKKVVKARDLLARICEIQLQTGMPYILHADAMNFKSNQKNLGYIRSSNLCVEICEYSSEDEIASCNLSSISLKAFVEPDERTPGYSKLTIDNIDRYYNFKRLGELTRRVVERLNRVIDNNYYPMDKIKNANLKHRPLGIGVSGFAEVLYQLKIPITVNSKLNPIVKRLNKMIFACMYFNGLVESLRLAIIHGEYSSFKGSPLSEGKFQFDLWRDEYLELVKQGRIDPKIRQEDDDLPMEPLEWDQDTIYFDVVGKPLEGFNIHPESRYYVKPDWHSLRELIKTYGVRNSLLMALMPTATSAQPLRNTETCELPQSNLYSRKILNGAYPVLNAYLVTDLKNIGLWEPCIYNLLQADGGSISKLRNYVMNNREKVPQFKGNFVEVDRIVNLYKTMWEVSSKVFMQLAADRGRYICQSQSTNVYLMDPTKEQMMALHQYGNLLGLKTGMYYLRSSSGVDQIKVTVDIDLVNYVENSKTKGVSNKKKQKVDCTDEICIVCQ